MSLMNPQVEQVAAQIEALLETQRAALAPLSAPALLELEHEMEHLRTHPRFTIRAGSEIVRAAAVLNRERNPQ